MSARSAIPPLFFSEYEDGPFENCAVCGCSLREPDVIYSVSKTCNQGEAIVEMAVCEDCSEELRGELSEESRKAVTDFVESALLESAMTFAKENEEEGTQVGPLIRLLGGPVETPEDPLELIDACGLCGKPRSDCRTFSVTAYCVGDEMIVQPSGPLSLGVPAMLCDECNSAASEKLSKETRDTWDKFYDEYVDTPPRITLDGPRPMIGI